ncbi:hypothetical protein CA13_36720 [Planctomycetes bacterium CA13]|uniref:Uncharacterized protein n=2 Tax=Novipirellula herctigrandis TaxID=2527986 RepID=A0A5C5Z5V9_9BACT|nr:hypothetical protein CA13_36720 [Planctomycetes bacterium CA13]
MDGALLCCFEKRGRSYVIRKESGANDWGDPVMVGDFRGGAAANPELCVLHDGQVFLFWNERPRQQERELRFTIRLSRSRDGGRTWQPRPEPIYIAGNTSTEGCWEPAAIQMPSGEIRLVFANEFLVTSDSPNSDIRPQEIKMMTSTDQGETWTEGRRVSFRPDHRDGMPVPVLLEGEQMVIAIEDNGVVDSLAEKHVFRPAIVDPQSSSRWEALVVDSPSACSIAAPYIVRLPSGATLLSSQSNEDDPSHTRMVVYVGDDHARDFCNRSLPFGLPPKANCKWNSLFVLNEDHVIAISNTTIDGVSGLWCVTGKVVPHP